MPHAIPISLNIARYAEASARYESISVPSQSNSTPCKHVFCLAAIAPQSSRDFLSAMVKNVAERGVSKQKCPHRRAKPSLPERNDSKEWQRNYGFKNRSFQVSWVLLADEIGRAHV